MLIIAHRGLLQGPDQELQNHPDQISRALNLGLDAEIDAWYIDGKWVLGHDEPEHQVDWNFMGRSGLWIHCKNLPAFFVLREDEGDHNYFWHETDAVVLTSRGFVWTYLGRPDTQSKNSICVMPEVTRSLPEIDQLISSDEWHGICTDHALRFKR